MDVGLALVTGRVIMGRHDLPRGAMATATAISDLDPVDRHLSGLMRDAQDGDRHAYACLLRECEPVIRRAARKVGVSGDRIEDAVQETLLTLHNARQTYDPTRSFTAWLSVIAQRRAIDILRRSGRSDRREVHAPVVYEQHAIPPPIRPRDGRPAGATANFAPPSPISPRASARRSSTSPCASNRSPKPQSRPARRKAPSRSICIAP